MHEAAKMRIIALDYVIMLLSQKRVGCSLWVGKTLHEIASWGLVRKGVENEGEMDTKTEARQISQFSSLFMF